MPTTVPGQVPRGFPAVTGDHWIETLNDGTSVLIRPIRPEDREREKAFIERLSPDSRHFRFLDSFREVAPAMLDRLMDTDGQRRVAFLALAHDDGTLREVGISRYSGEGDGCECAVTVADDWRHRGLAAVLMRHLIDAARRNGFRRLFSLDAAANEPMRELAHYLGFTRRADPDDASQVVHELAL